MFSRLLPVTRLSLLGVRGFAADIDASKLTIELTKRPKTKTPKEELKFGKTTSDHLLEIDWEKQNGWGAPRIRPYAPFQIDPAASVFHYGLECFEGMKAYLDDSNQIRMFRPDKNMVRMNASLARLQMPHLTVISGLNASRNC